MAISYSTFFEMSITASLMIAAILLFRVIFKRAPRWVFCLMWGIVALRLVLPVSLESRFSLLPEKEVISNSAVAGVIFDKDVNAKDVLSDHFQNEGIGDSVPDNDSQIVGSGTNVTVLDSDIPSEQIHSGTSDITVPEDGTSSSPGTAVRDEGTLHTKGKSFRITVSNALFAVWITGFLVLTGYFAVSSVSIRLRLNTATLLYKNIKQSESVKSPFVMGIFSPKIYLPYKIDVSDMTYVLAHEKAHISRGDHITKVIAFALLSVYWFNPLVWAAYIMFCRDIELACDEKVVKSLDIAGRRAYSYALLNCSVKQNTFAGCPVAFGETDVRRRVKGVMKYKKPAFAMVALSLAAGILASLCLMTYPVAQESVHIEGGDDNFGAENNDSGENENGYSPYESSDYTSNGVIVTATDVEPTDGKYYNFLMDAGGKKTEFSGEALSTFLPQVYRKNVARSDTPEIIVNLVTEHGNGVHKEQVHIFDLLSLENLRFPDFVSEIASTMTIDETESYYMFKFSTRSVVLEKSEVYKRGIDLSGELIYDSCYRYSPYLLSSYGEERFNLEMLWKEADGDVFARVYIFFYCENTRFVIADAQILFEDDKNADLDSYPTNIYMLNDASLLVSAATAGTVFDDGKYHSADLFYNNKKASFDVELAEECKPFVFLQDINVVYGNEIVVRLISDNSGGIYRETMHIFNSQTLERLEVLDIGTQVAEELRIVETASYYIVYVADSKIQFEKAELEKRGINIYEAVFDSYVSYENFMHPETKQINFACKLLCKKPDGSVFGELYLLILEHNGNYLTTSTYFEYIE